MLMVFDEGAQKQKSHDTVSVKNCVPYSALEYQ